MIDARGQVVAPGFIDIHTHSDFTLPLNQRAESKIRQGVTLEVVGNCGFSVAPSLPGQSAMLREYLASSATWLPFHDTTFAEYVAGFPPTSVNVILQVGHNTLRLMTAGLDNRPLTADELATMERLLEEALAAGAWGLSSGLFTAPGNFADAAEIHALAREGMNLGGVGEVAGRGEEARRQAPGPGGERLLQQTLHRGELVGRERAVVEPGRHQPQRVVADLEDHVHRRRRKVRDVLGKGGVVKGQPGRAGGQVLALHRFLF